jgi:tight adherence protein B
MNPIIFLWLGGALVVLTIFIGIILTLSSQKSAEEKRLDAFIDAGIELPEKQDAKSSIFTEWLSSKVEETSWSDKVSKELAQADIKMKPGEFIFVTIASIVVVGLVGYVIGSKSLLLAILGAVLGYFLPRIYIRSQRNRRLVKFNNQLSDMLSLMVNGLRAGFSTLQSMEAVAKEMPSPISDEFRRVIQEVTLGVSTDKALDNLVRRIPSDDLDLVVTAMKVQREVGGNLAEILDTISHTIRERVRIKGEIRTLTAQMKYSARILGVLPIGLTLAIYLVNREYIMVMLSQESNTPFPCGILALVIALILVIVGYFVMDSFTNIEV